MAVLVSNYDHNPGIIRTCKMSDSKQPNESPKARSPRICCEIISTFLQGGIEFSRGIGVIF